MGLSLAVSAGANASCRSALRCHVQGAGWFARPGGSGDCRTITAQPGNHLVFCPSMAYLGELEPKLAPLVDRPVFARTSLMDEGQRTAFLDRFHPGEAGVGLAVLGGIFSEGIDLPGERLLGVAVIGVGLPRLSVERDILQAHFQKTRGEGFDFAYRFPGMQRVLQAVGRLIRSEEDRGAALLIDQRFTEWRSSRVVSGVVGSKSQRVVFPELVCSNPGTFKSLRR